MRQPEVVTHCRLCGRSNLDANHYVFAGLREQIAVEGSKGVNPWE